MADKFLGKGLHKLLGAVLLCVSLVGGCGERPVPSTHSSRIIWICLDSLRFDHLGLAGYKRETSPWMDEFASEAANFTWAVSPSDVTWASVSAFLTGRRPSELGASTAQNTRVPTETATLFEVLKEAGFQTLLWTSNPNASARQGLDRSVDSYKLLKSSSQVGTIDDFIDELRLEYRRPPGKEFLYFHLMDVHTPYTPPRRFDRMFVGPDYSLERVRKGLLYDANGNIAFSERSFYNLRGDTFEGGPVESRHLDQLVAAYDGGIRFTDSRLPDLLAAIDYDAESDVVIISADHGEQFFEHGWWGHGFSTLSEEIRVPLLIRVPGARGRTLTTPVSLLDVFPTICELAGAAPPADLAGKSLLPAIRGEPLEDRMVISEGLAEGGPKATLVTGRYLYQIQPAAHLDDPSALWPYRERLYDLVKDPACEHDILARSPEVAGRLNDALRSMDSYYGEFSRARMTRGGAEFDFGPNRLISRVVRTGKGGEEGDGTQVLALDASKVLAEAVIEAPLRRHLLSFSYVLSGGSVALKLYGDTGPDPVWSCTLYTSKPNWTRFQSVFIPDHPGKYRLEMSIERSGAAKIQNLALRAFSVPELKLGGQAKSGSVAPAGQALSESEKARLKALGYL